MPEKRVLRKRLHKVRDNLTNEQVRTFSKLIHQKINNLNVFRSAQTVHTYLSIAARHEVDTLSIAGQLLAEKKAVVVPVTLFDDHSLKHVFLERLDNLVPNKWHVSNCLNPIMTLFSLDDLDLILVPMLGGDVQKRQPDWIRKRVRSPSFFKTGTLPENRLAL